MKMSIALIAACAGTLVLAQADFAQAQNLLSYVSGQGNNLNNCKLPAPCRSFPRALMVTNAGGTIVVLDPAEYGALIIDKAISIVNDGVGTSSIQVPSAGTGITINAGVNDVVSLRGLTIRGTGGASQLGIKFTTGRSLTIENSVIRRVANGIDFRPNATSSLLVSNTLVADLGGVGILVIPTESGGPSIATIENSVIHHATASGIDFRPNAPNAHSSLMVSNTLVAYNGTVGILVWPTGSGPVTAVFNRVEAINNNAGIQVSGSNSTGTVKVTASDTVAARNGVTGFEAATYAGRAPTTIELFRSIAANNGSEGISASGTGATIRVAQSMVTGNQQGWIAIGGGVVESYGDNYFVGNAFGNLGALTPVARQ